MTQVGSVYGEALYDLCRSETLEGEILEQITVLEESFSQEPDFLRLLASPNLTKQERCKVLEDAFRDKLHPDVLNFIKILTEKGYARHFSDSCAAYREHYNLDHGILPVQAVTAVALTESQKEKLSAKLGEITGKTIQLTNRVEPACLGGVRLDFDGKRLDDTVSHRLESVRNMLNKTIL